MLTVIRSLCVQCTYLNQCEDTYEPLNTNMPTKLKYMRYSHNFSHWTENQYLSAPKIDYMQKFQKYAQQGLSRFDINLVFIISITEILGIPNTRKYFLLFLNINILLVLTFG